MNIPKNLSTCKSASTKLLNPVDIGSGNIIPNWWYSSTILTTGGKADTTAIVLLSELWFLYRSTGQEEHQKDYDYFGNKFNLSQFQIREAFIRLEAIDLMHRSIGSIVVQGRKFANILFVTLHVKQLLEMSLKVCKSSTKEDDNDPNEEIFLGNRVSDPEEIESEILKANKIKKNLEADRSTGSNFNSNNSLAEETTATNCRFSFASFYPLVQSDIDNLQNLCGREFSSDAINEILLSLSKKLPKHSFPHKKAFINYMAKALSYEMRDAVKISNESFKIKTNLSSFDTSFKQQEAFLSRIEESRDTSREAQLSRKLAGVLAPDIAYKFLSSANFPKETSSSKSETFTIRLQENIELKSIEHCLILEQVRSVYGDHINSLDFKIAKSIKHIKQSNVNDTGLLTKASTTFQGVWGRIRQSLINYYGHSGAGLDNAWFSKLTAEEDSMRKQLTLKAPSIFIKDWIQSNYLQLINTICLKENYQLTGVFA